ncbi:hypothetical protein [Colibacter massiliensis]|nr:hypothetical protein [Colibacter massiliensis]
MYKKRISALPCVLPGIVNLSAGRRHGLENMTTTRDMGRLYDVVTGGNE